MNMQFRAKQVEQVEDVLEVATRPSSLDVCELTAVHTECARRVGLRAIAQ